MTCGRFGGGGGGGGACAPFAPPWVRHCSVLPCARLEATSIHTVLVLGNGCSLRELSPPPFAFILFEFNTI